MTQTLAEWLSWLEVQHPKSIDMGLERVGQVADRLLLREPGCPVITVGGTNGKGSTVATLVSIYRAGGLKVGSYTSPHILHFNERICLNGEPVSDAVLVAAFERLRAVQGDISLTYFEFTTLAALLIFREAGLDVLVLEVGLGGRLDAVNLVDADVAVVTSIGIDHVEYLGPTRELIAIEKAGIFRSGRPAICGDAEPPASLQAAALERGAHWQCRGTDFFYDETSAGWNWCSGATVLKDLPKPRLALANAATAVAAVMAAPVSVSEDAVRAGLQAAALPGRLQQVASAPDIILDVAHNPHGAAFLMQQLSPKKAGQRTLAVFAMLADKDVAGVADACCPYIDAWHVASLDVPRGASAAQLLPVIGERTAAQVSAWPDVAAALAAARQQAGPADRILVFGSFYTVAAAWQAL